MDIFIRIYMSTSSLVNSLLLFIQVINSFIFIAIDVVIWKIQK